MERKALTGYKITLHVLTLILLVWKLSVREWGHAGLCVLCLALYSLPFLLGLLLHASIPPLLEAAALTFAAAANLGGEVLGMYLRTPVWDSGLHFVWGILAAVIGYAMPDLLGRREGITRAFPTSAAVLLSVSFAMLTAVLWEFVEYFVDLWFHTDMQKDSWIAVIHSVMLQPDGTNQALTEEIQSVVVNGHSWPAYLDIGLKDTMQDMLWTFAGSVPGAMMVFADHRHNGGSFLLARLLPRPKPMKKDGKCKP